LVVKKGQRRENTIKKTWGPTTKRETRRRDPLHLPGHRRKSYHKKLQAA